jgi:acetylornithine deacetylase
MPAPASPKEILAHLVAFDTVSDKTNIPLIKWVAAWLEGQGVASELVPTADGTKASLFATIGPSGAGGIGLSGHTDVVPVVGQPWDSDPFMLTERNGRLYGRGTADMKGFLACVLASVPALKRRKLRVPFHVVFSYDEEIGCTGVRPMIAEFGKRLPMPRCVIVGEPTSMTVVDAHKGPVRWRVALKGLAAHSSMAHIGVNTITYAGRLLGELDRMEQEFKARTPNPRFEPPYTTLQVTRIEGGAASNIVPQDTWFGFEIRALPDCDPAAVEARIRRFAEEQCLPEMRKVFPDASIEIALTNEVPAFAADPSSEIVALALRAAEANETFAVSYATEASLFHRAGAPTVIVGPGDIAQAHTANEWIDPAELDSCMRFIARLADWAEAA